MSRSKKDYLFLALKGIAIGVGEFIPGFSGATVAFISGIYKELVDSVANLKPSSLKVLFKHGIKEFWTKINGNFLLIIFSTIVLSLFTFTYLANYLFKTFPISTWSFLFGVIIASLIYIFKDFKEWRFKEIVFIIIGIAINVLLTFLTPLEMSSDSSYWIILVCAFIAAFTVYFPGVSVSLVFVLLGQYRNIIKSISNFEMHFILIYFGGFIIGFIIISKLFSWILNKYNSFSISFLAGLLIGSLYKLWPWKEQKLGYLNLNDVETLPRKLENLLPNDYFELTHKDPQTLYAILMAITGFLVVYLLHNTFSKNQETHE
jgi:putative membrane protein